MNVLLDLWVFPKIGIPQNGLFIMENPIKMDVLGIPLFLETPICTYLSEDGVRTTRTPTHFSGDNEDTKR